ncbi:MAG: DUF5320 domain-containing protein [Armatimonadetes bacterium]|nr:DUF5320 domain-containing protein [Armatimonadota bacterium]
MRRRNMYYATGLPGWMRFGYSPGWVGRSPNGLGPCAQFLTTGQWPAPMAGAMPTPPVGMPAGMPGQPDPEQQLAFLQAQAATLEQQLQAIRDQLQELEES